MSIIDEVILFLQPVTIASIRTYPSKRIAERSRNVYDRDETMMRRKHKLMTVETKSSRRAIETRYATKTRDSANLHTEKNQPSCEINFQRMYVRFERMSPQGQYVRFLIRRRALKITRFLALLFDR